MSPTPWSTSLQAVLVEELEALAGMEVETLKRRRYQRLMSYGRFKDQGPGTGMRLR